MLLLGIKTNTQCVHAGTDVSRQDGDLGNIEHTGGGSLRRAHAQILQAWGLLGFIIIWGPIFSQVYLEREGEWR